MEYLMTYGWAILVVLAVIAVLMFVMKPQPIETCQVQQPFECVAGSYAMFKANSSLYITVKNAGWERIKIINSACGYNGTDFINPMPINKELSPGETYNLWFDCLTEDTAKVGQDVFQGEVYIIFNPRASDTSVSKTTSVRIAAKYS
ncbi:MAG: hypothetical protein QW112_01600 [Candidatus Micrarchaeia archaeon]